MESAILFIILIIIILSNNGKVKLLTSKIDTLEGKIDDLKHFLKTNSIIKASKVKEPITTEKELSFTEEIKKKAEPKVDLEKKHAEIIEKIKAEKELKQKELEQQKRKKEKIPVVNFTEEKQKDAILNKQLIKEKVIPQKTLSDKLDEKIKSFKTNNPDIEKFIGENLISKIGILILVLGISFFVKFAIDNNWINEVGRVGIGFLSGGILLGFAFKLKKNYKAFSSILVSGAITIFYFIITYAFKEYELFSQTTAFALLVIITIFSTLISILYDRKELGVLSLIGGFLVPILVSTGSGNYTVLFSYLLILNIGFLIVSIKKKWFIINILTFVFTHLFFISWLLKDNHLDTNAPRLFLFATLFYIVFYLMNIYRVIKEKEYAMKPIVMMLFLISTFVFFGQGLYLLGYFAPNFKGAFTLLLAIVNLVSGWLLLKNKIVDTKTVYLFIGMTLTFLTLAGPIQLEGNYITLFWAAETALLIWLSQKIKNNDFKIVAFITIILALGSLFIDFEHIYYSSNKLNIILNKGFITGAFVTIALLISSYLFHKEKEPYTIKNITIEIVPSKIKTGLIIIAGFVLYLTGLLELNHQTTHYFDSYLSNTIIVIYNYIFIIIGIYFALKSKNDGIEKIGLIGSLITLVYGATFIGSTPFRSFYNSIDNKVSNPTFYVQFLLFGALVYIIYLIYKYINKKYLIKVNYTFVKYFIAAIFVVLVSLEVLIISQPILITPKLSMINDIDVSLYRTISQSKKAVIKTSFPILWGLLSFVFLFFGIKKNKKEWRVFALVLIAVTVLKLFIYDIGNVSQGGKIVAFIILGVVLLVISFMYQRIKKLFNDNEENNDKA